MRRTHVSGLLIALGISALAAVGTASARTITSFELVPRNASCLPNAAGAVSVVHKEDMVGLDTLHLAVRGLPAKTGFEVFLTSDDAFATPADGSAYLGAFTTDASGDGSLKVEKIIAEATAKVPAGTPGVRTKKDLDHLVFRFANPTQVPDCFISSGAFDLAGDGRTLPVAMTSEGVTGLEEFPQ